LTVTWVSPENPRTRAAAGDRSIIRPRTKGPRSLMVTTTECPLLLFVTVTFVPIGRVRCAAVRASRFNSWPLGSATALNGVDRGNADLIRKCTRKIVRRELTG
jgi:hypothetical protein